jgi:hypothetical protein
MDAEKTRYADVATDVTRDGSAIREPRQPAK